MEWVAALQGSIVGLDTTPLIYFIEENPYTLTWFDLFSRLSTVLSLLQ